MTDKERLMDLLLWALEDLIRTYGPTSRQANEAMRVASRYAERHGLPLPVSVRP